MTGQASWKAICLLLSLFCSCVTSRSFQEKTGTKTGTPKIFDNEYGVFLSLGPDETKAFAAYRIIVIDAQYFSTDQVRELKTRGHTVLSYINVGAIENFRPYYTNYQSLTLGQYETWPEERWVDLSRTEWQRFILDNLSQQLLDKGIDGFFVDNADVYAEYSRRELMEGLVLVLRGLTATGKAVVINGGAKLIADYLLTNKNLDGLITGINQEEVFSLINFDDRALGSQTESGRRYYLDLLTRIRDDGKDIYLLEYTTSQELIERITTFCSGFPCKYYISNSIELDG